MPGVESDNDSGAATVGPAGNRRTRGVIRTTEANPLDPPPPAVSVLMPVRDAEAYLAEAVASILCQTFADFEFLIIDDGSADRTRQILRRFEVVDPRVRVWERPATGFTKQLNFGLGLCRGEFVARMDGDDVAAPDRLRLQVEHLRRHPEAVVVGGAYDLIDSRGRLLRREWPATDDAALQSHALDGQTPIAHPTALMRRSSVREVGGYDESMRTGQDNDLWLRLGEVGELACVPAVVLGYRQHPKSVSELHAADQAANIRRGCEKAYRRRGLDRAFEPPPAWRPTGEDARFKFLLQYGWWAFNEAQRSTAIAYGLRAVGERPFRHEPWNLLYASTCKALPDPKPPPYPTTPGFDRREAA